MNPAAEGRSLAKYNTKELSVMSEEEYERSTRFAHQASPSWSEVKFIRDMSDDRYSGEVGIYVPYLKAEFNSPLLIDEKNPAENGERIRGS